MGGIAFRFAGDEEEDSLSPIEDGPSKVHQCNRILDIAHSEGEADTHESSEND